MKADKTGKECSEQELSTLCAPGMELGDSHIITRKDDHTYYM